MVGFTDEGEPVFAEEFRVTGALLALLQDALQPNLVQSMEGVPAFLHGGPFANIAHGCNSVLATRMALAHADYAVTEAGFAFDLGGEKFMGIKCRQSGLAPAAIVIVATVRALKMHGGVALTRLTKTDVGAVERGLENLAAHLDSAAQFERPVLVAINRFHTDHEDEIALVHRFCAARGVPSATADVFAQGGDGAIELADAVVAAVAPKIRCHCRCFIKPATASKQSSTPSPRASMARTACCSPPRQRRNSRFLRAAASTVSRSAWPRRRTPCPTTRRSSAARATSTSPCATSRSPTAPDSSSPSPATMLRMPALPKVPAAERIEVADDGIMSGI